jgi:hypothetical protein
MSRKPNTRDAMQALIDEIRQVLPFDLSAQDICKDECRNCSLKLLGYLENELDSWQYRLDSADKPNLGDVSKLARSARKIYTALQKNGLIQTTVGQEE